MGRLTDPPKENGAKADETKKPAEDSYVRIASTSDVSPEDLAKLLDQLDSLKSELATERGLRSEAEKRALAAAEAQGSLMLPGIEEVPTGKMVTVKRSTEYEVVGYKDDGREIRKPIFHDVELPTFFYKIDLPPSGGIDLKINSVPMYHGSTVEVDLDTLRAIKEIIYRGWDHERNITGSNENAYRQQKRPVISARGM